MFSTNRPISSGAIQGAQNAAYNEKACAELAQRQDTCSPATNQKVASVVMDELDGIIHRMMSLSDRQESACDRLFGPRPDEKDDSAQPMMPGVVGVIASKLDMLRRIVDAMETNTYRIEQLA